MNLEAIGPFVPLILLLTILYLIFIRPASKRKKMLDELMKRQGELMQQNDELTQRLARRSLDNAIDSNEDPYEAIEKLSNLLKEGHITQVEFDEKKKKLWSKI